jgi:hypothetical protein
MNGEARKQRNEGGQHIMKDTKKVRGCSLSSFI